MFVSNFKFGFVQNVYIRLVGSGKEGICETLLWDSAVFVETRKNSVHKGFRLDISYADRMFIKMPLH